MADVGSIATNDEVYSFCKASGWPSNGSFEPVHDILIKGVESEVAHVTGRTFPTGVKTDEEHSIPPAILRDGFAIGQTFEFQVKHYPITAWSSLKKVTGRDASSGAVSSSDTIQRNSYHVDLETGVVRMIDPSTLSLWDTYPGAGFPAGTKILLATYTAGYAPADIPDDLKLLVLQIIARLFIQQKNGLWGQTSQAIEGFQNNYPDVEFTKSEMGKLERFSKPVFSRS